MNQYAIALATGLSLVATAADAANTTWREQSGTSIDVAGLREVEVSNPRGVVTVRRGTGDKLHMTALKITRGTDKEHAIRFAKATEVLTSNEGGRYKVRVRYPQRQNVRVGFFELFSGFELPAVDVRLELEIPDGLRVRLATTSGDLESEAITGAQVLESTSGDISVRDAKGSLQVQSTSGDVTVDGMSETRIRTVSGDLRLDRPQGPVGVVTTSGNITVNDAADSIGLVTVSGDVRVSAAPRGLSARTTSGEVSAKAAAGVIRIESASGDVHLGLDAPLRGALVKTGSGEIVLDLPRSLGCVLDLDTTNGTIDSTLPMTLETVTRRRVHGRVGRGSAPVQLRSSSGDITVRSGGE